MTTQIVFDGREMETLIKGLNKLVGELAKSPSMVDAVEEDYARALAERLQKVAGKYPVHFLGVNAAKALIDAAAANGQSFTVLFVKRDGTMRRLVGRVGLADKSALRYDPANRGVVLVHDLEKDAPRMVPLDRVISVRCEARCDRVGL